jgi:hypothetical protein
MNRAQHFPMAMVWGAATILTLISGLAAQLCYIGHGPVLPVLLLAPFSAFFMPNSSGSFPVCIAVLQFPAYAAALTVGARRGVLGKVGVVILLAHCIGVVSSSVRAL